MKHFIGSISIHFGTPERRATQLKKKPPDANRAPDPGRKPHRVRLPGFIADDEIGLGDAIKRVTYAVGIKPCGGCDKRAAALNRWMVFTR